jgi:hypothetical protein
MSLKDNTNELQNALRDAQIAGIIVLASTSDESWNLVKAWPACSESVIAISSANTMGRLVWDQLKEKGPHYVFQGEDITVDDTVVGGSSAATAMAVGVASLLISCYKCSLNESEDSSKTSEQAHFAKTRRTVIINCFNKMIARLGDTNYCAPWKLFPENGSDWDFGGPEEVLNWMVDMLKKLNGEFFPSWNWNPRNTSLTTVSSIASVEQ